MRGKAFTTAITIALGLALVLGVMAPVSQSSIDNGFTPEPRAIFQIFDVNDLQDMQNHLTDDCVLMNDIDASATSTWNWNLDHFEGFVPIGTDFNPFAGSFNGNNYSINNLYINRSSTSYVGLFGSVVSTKPIHDVILSGVNITGQYSVGALLGYGYCNVSNCHISGNVTAVWGTVGGLIGNSAARVANCTVQCNVQAVLSSVGGLIGFQWTNSITNCTAICNIIGEDNTGGFIGRSDGNVEISNCTAMSSIYTPLGSNIGGFVGRIDVVNISDCISYSNISNGDYYVGGFLGCQGDTAMIERCASFGSVSGYGYVGGFAGFWFGATGNDCYSQSSVAGSQDVGGFVGCYGGPLLTDCYSTGFVSNTGSNTGGFIGYLSFGTTENCFWDNQTSNHTSSAAGTGEFTSEMKVKSTFTSVGWDFSNIWGIVEGVTYPFFGPVVITPRSPIRINSNADFDEAHGVTNWATGDGSQGNPWIIENWDINGTGFGYCIFVGNATEYFEIRDCYLHDADGVSSFPLAHDSGVILYKTQNGLVKNNTLYSNDWMGVQCICSENNTISYNIANNNSRGIRIWYSNFTYVNNNNFSSNEYFGCYIHESSNNTFDTNVVCNNGQRGFTFISDSIYNNVSNNYVSLNGWGGLILQMRSNFNIINNNTISNNRDGLIISSFSAYNRVYHNNVINNTNQSRSGINNYWDNGYPSGGNYWSDYKGVDYNSTPTQDVPPPDGIGDTPYTIGGIAGVVDQYPLMAPFQFVEYNVPLQEGWNLISLPIRQLNGSIDSVLQSIEGFWDCLQTYDTETQTWMSNNTHRPAILNDLNEMNHLKAYWINITQSGQTLTVKGDKFDSPIGMPLKAGWNLVGYPTMTQKSISEALVGTGYDRPVEGFNASAPYRISPLADTYQMKPGEGYWVHVPVDTTWIIDW